jgi:hypothetical protein
LYQMLKEISSLLQLVMKNSGRITFESIQFQHRTKVQQCSCLNEERNGLLRQAFGVLSLNSAMLHNKSK